MKPVLVFGKNGQLARALSARATPECPIIALGHAEIDILSAEAVAGAIAAHQPRIIINTAAYTAVDKAESEPEDALALNRTAAGVIANAAANAGVPLIHVSTDYVYNGNPGRPWREDDPIDPQSVYGRTKAEGEKQVIASGADAAIIRTSWLYAEEGTNFLRTMLRLGAERDRLAIVDDQIGAPTWVTDLAGALLTMANKGIAEGANIYHVVNAGETTWHCFAKAIFEEAASRGQKVPETLDTTTTEAFGAPAPRPSWSVLDCGKAKDAFGIDMPHWRDALSRCMAALDKLDQ